MKLGETLLRHKTKPLSMSGFVFVEHFGANASAFSQNIVAAKSGSLFCGV
ncbi:MAG: hypothetical protein UY61_C0034G0014 [Candidatus Adlerbacteria bacterium GW2011_GWC1_50_9]|uniref:Uncharacterized protein n=1 Tax=Candidatus Adlerbacteria bacterium GW2011_GWC1_50_9 TaxID=1618608 RepID=A0A0G1WPA9_9BACT|nr:MAG: hypothetical protein UY61_C0034G0014 [Candidatus Adlerbacteria bacterium GW2011_GWC1_50_9]